MRYVGIGISGYNYNLEMPLYVRIDMDEDAPAHGLNVTFPISSDINQNVEELNYIKVYSDDMEKLIFDGIVDEQETELSSSGAILKISSRSIVAILLDNEALPQTYYLPSIDTIFKRHVKPYGFNGYIGNNKQFSTSFKVKKGMSEWSVLESFCNDFLEVTPFFTNDRKLDITGGTSGENIIFSNKGDGFKYTSISKNVKRCDLISEVFVRCQKDGSYSNRIYSQKNIDSGIIKKCYLNSLDDIKTPVFRGEQIINKSLRDSFEINLVCIGGIFTEIGASASILDDSIGDINNLVVSNIRYRLSLSGEFCEVKLKYKI